MKNLFSFRQTFQNSDSTLTTLESLASLNEIISSSQDEMDFFHESGGLHLILTLLHSDKKLVCICLKILFNASKRNEKFRQELVKTNIFHLLCIRLKNEADFSRNSLILYAALIVRLVHGDDYAQDQIRTSGCLSYLVYILNTLLADTETKPLPYRNIELVVYSIITSNKGPRHLENQTEVGWITPKIVEYLGKQSIFSNSDQIQVMKCFWSFLKSILHKNEFNQQIFLKCCGFVVLFRSMQEIVDEKKSVECNALLIKMTAVLIRMKSQKPFLYLASSYCSLMILCSLLHTHNALVIQHVIIFLDALTREIPHALHPTKNKQLFQGLMRAKIMLSKSKSVAEICQSIWDRTVISSKDPSQDNTFNADSCFTKLFNKFDTLSQYSSVKNQSCIIHGSDALEKSQFHSNYFFDLYESVEPVDYSKEDETNKVKVCTVRVRNQLKERRALKYGKINRNRSRKRLTVTIRRVFQFFEKLRSFFLKF